MVVGLDLGHYEVKAVQLDKSGQGYRLLKAASAPMVSRDQNFDPEKIGKSQWVAGIADCLKKLHLKPKRVKRLVSSIDGNHTSVKQIQTMEMVQEELASSLQFEARKHIPLDGSDAVLDFQILGEDRQALDKINVLLVATTRRNFNQHAEILREAGLKPGVVDADSVALANAYLSNHVFPDTGLLVFLNMGALSSTLVVWGRDGMFYSREIPIAGHQVTKSIMNRDHLEYSQAEEVKQAEGVTHLNRPVAQDALEATGITVADHSIYDELVEDLRRSLRYYVKTTNQGIFHRIYLMGGSASTPGLPEFISEKLNVPVEVYNPFDRMTIDDAVKIENPPQYSIAVGLAARGLN